MAADGGMLAAINLASNPSYTYTMSIEQYQEELSQLISIEDKLALFRCQFPQDPFQFDLGHTSQAL